LIFHFNKLKPSKLFAKQSSLALVSNEAILNPN